MMKSPRKFAAKYTVVATGIILANMGMAPNAYAFMDNFWGLGGSNADNANNSHPIESTYCKPGFYIGAQGGRSETYYRPGNVLAAAANNENAMASPYTITSTNQNTGVTTETTFHSTFGGLQGSRVNDIGIGGRVFAGYQFAPGFAAELGYTQYAKTEFSATGFHTANTTVENQPVNVKSFDKYQGQITQHAMDLVGKATLPLQGGFGVYAKAGMAYITATRTTNATYNTSTQLTSPATSGRGVTVTPRAGGSQLSTIATQTYQAFRPTYGAGIDYTFPHSPIDVDISWTRIQGMGHGIPNADLAAIGLSYKFA